MKRLQSAALALLATFVLFGGNCSRAHVESLTLMNEGVANAQQHNYITAVEKLERATVIDPQNDLAWWNMALVYMEEQKFPQAREALNHAITINPQSAGYQEKLGTILIELSDWASAKTAFEKAIELDPNLPKAYYKLAQVLEQMDDQQSALRRYTEAVQKGPRFLEAYQSLGRLYADLGYLEQAVQVLQAAQQVALPGTEEGARVHHLLGTVFLEQEKFDDAVREFRAALDVVPGFADALFSLGWTYARQDNREEAKRYLKKFLEVAGSDTPRHYVRAAQDKLSEINGL